MRRKQRTAAGRGSETWLLGCEPGAEGCFGRPLDPPTSGRAGGATMGDVKNTQRHEKLWGKCQGTEVSSGVESFPRIYASLEECTPYTTGRIFFFLYIICCCCLDRHFISNSKYIINFLLSLLEHPIFYISWPRCAIGLFVPVHAITVCLTGFSRTYR